jgi:hypothetical protein
MTQYDNGILLTLYPYALVIDLMAITPMACYEKIFSGLHKPMVSGSKMNNVPVISFEEFAQQLENFMPKALKESNTP